MRNLLFTALLCVSSVAYSQQEKQSSSTSRIPPGIYDVVRDMDNYSYPANEIKHFPDSLLVEFQSLGALVVFNFADVDNEYGAVSVLPEDLEIWLSEIEPALADTTIPHIIHISFARNGDRYINIEERKKMVTRVTSRRDKVVQLLPPGWEIYVHKSITETYIYAQDLDGLRKICRQDFKVLEDSLRTEVKRTPYKRHRLEGNLIVADNRVVHSAFYRQNVNDVVEGNAGAGFGFAGNYFYPEFHGSVNFILRDWKNVKRTKITFEGSNQVFSVTLPSGRLKAYNTPSLNFSVNTNLVDSNDEPVWVGIGMGILPYTNSPLFPERMVKFFINTTLGRFTLSPELYLINKYKDATAGFRMSYGF
ncbi:MAG: hypothetical protein V4616_14190 [Bacteroidota bacterium]